jgi:hypothetical protein
MEISKELLKHLYYHMLTAVNGQDAIGTHCIKEV